MSSRRKGNTQADEDDDDDLLMALQSMEPCGNCGAQGASIPCMSGCGEVYYCSRVNFHLFYNCGKARIGREC